MQRTNPQSGFLQAMRSRSLVLKLSTSGFLVEKRAACGAIAFFDYAFTYPQHNHL
jgi:hypothetical protein